MLLRSAGRDSVVALVLALLLFWAPLPAGSVTPAAALVFRLAAFGLFALALTARAGGWSRSRILPAAALAGVAALGLVQSCPWPAGVAGIASPEHARLYEQAAALIPNQELPNQEPPDQQPPDPQRFDPERADERPREPPSFLPLSLDAVASRSAALSWLAAAALLTAIFAASERARHRRWLLTALVAAAMVQIAVGLARLGDASPAGLAAVLLRPEGRLRGTFANPNHLSLFFELTMAAVAAWSWLELTGRSGAPRRPLRPLVPPLLWLLLLTGVVLTGSRAGLAAALLGFAVQAAAMTLAGRGRRSWLAAAVLLALLVVAAGLGSRVEIRRYATVSPFEDNIRSRLELVPPSVELWRRYPLTGTGLGTFEDAFPAVATPELAPVLWNRAHNDPLELLVTGGLVGLVLGLVAIIALMPPIWRVTRGGSGAEDRAVGLAALGALAAAGFHELLDFGLVIPANHLALLVILGAAAAAGSAAGRRRPEGHEPGS